MGKFIINIMPHDGVANGASEVNSLLVSISTVVYAGYRNIKKL